MSLPDVAEVVADDLRRRRALWLLVPVVTVSGYLLWGWQSGTFAADEQGKGAASTSRTVAGSTESVAGARDTGLELRAGSVEGLAPGVVRSLLVSVTNEAALSPGETRDVRVAISMPATGRNQDACKRASCTLLLTATGTTS